MKIGVDIDDVITNTGEMLVAYAQLFCIEDLGKTSYIEKENVYKIVNGDTLEKNLNWTKEQVITFKKKYHEYILSNCNIKPLAKEIIDRLINEGHQIHFVTARNKTEDLISDSYKVSEVLLAKNKIKYHKLITECSDKLAYCKENNIDVFIDDKLETCKAIATSNTQALLMNGSHNISLDEDGITRVYSWADIYYRIKEKNKV